MYTSRWTLAVLLGLAALLGLATAASIENVYKREAAPNPHAYPQRGGQQRKPVRRPIKFPDTNNGKTINRGDRPITPKCKKWFTIRDALLREVFNGAECGNAARAAVRLAFHDAATFSLRRQRFGQSNGAADGSLLTDPAEVLRPENNGLQRIVAALKPFPRRFGVAPGDILHVAGILAVIICPGGPPIETYVGRPNPKNIAPTGLLPDVRDSVPKMLERFSDMGLDVRDTMALIGAHSTATQRFVDPRRAGQSMDSTPDIWDVKFYGETLNRTTQGTRIDGVFHFQSDIAFSRHPLSKKEFERFVDDQDDWDEDYADAHERMSLLGLDRSRLTRCTEILPPKIDLGPLFVDKDAGMESEDEAEVEKDDSFSLKVDRARLREVLKRLRGYWGWSKF